MTKREEGELLPAGCFRCPYAANLNLRIELDERALRTLQAENERLRAVLERIADWVGDGAQDVAREALDG